MFHFKTAAEAAAFVSSLGAPDDGEAYEIEAGGKFFFVVHMIDGVSAGRI